MTTASIIITVASGTAFAACFVSAGLVIADIIERRISEAWWRKRDPLWQDPLSPGASASYHGCSDRHTDKRRTTVRNGGYDANSASHPAKNQPKGRTSLGPDRTPWEFISALMASGALRRVA